jgi:serine/threonine protein kinase
MPIQYVHCFVKSLGWFEDSNSLFIAMEYATAGDLQRYIDRRFSEREVILITSQVLDGLQYMHEEGFAHRDLKPAVRNCSLQRRVLDFCSPSPQEYLSHGPPPVVG